MNYEAGYEKTQHEGAGPRAGVPCPRCYAVEHDLTDDSGDCPLGCFVGRVTRADRDEWFDRVSEHVSGPELAECVAIFEACGGQVAA